MDDGIDGQVRQFRDYLKRKGYSKNVVKNYGFRLSTFLKACPEVAGKAGDDMRAMVEAYVAGLPANTARTVPAGALRTWWSSLFGAPYKPKVVISGQVIDDTVRAELEDYEGYLRGLRRLSESTIQGCVHTVTQFLCSVFPDGGFAREGVTCETVVDFVTRTMAHTTAKTRAGQVSRIRSYARFLRERGVDVGMLDQMSFTFPNRRERVGVGVLSEQSYMDLVAACDTGTERGARDAAMICCLGNLGLRACDVASLRLDSINWREGVLTVKDSKSKTQRRLPLDEQTGTALEQYAARRRHCETRTLFLDEAGGPVTSVKIQTAVRLAAGRASIPEYHGTYGLRRMVATNMINAGVDIKVIADVLGHERIATTAVYTTVDVTSLRKVVASWPEEVWS